MLPCHTLEALLTLWLPAAHNLNQIEELVAAGRSNVAKSSGRWVCQKLWPCLCHLLGYYSYDVLSMQLAKITGVVLRLQSPSMQPRIFWIMYEG